MRLSAVALALVVSGALLSPGFAATLPGKGPSTSECYVTLKVEGTATATAPNKLDCKDGDPACDQSPDCHDGCKFNIQACPNQPGISGCSPSSLTKLVAKVKGQSLPQPSLTGSACGGFLSLTVPLKKHGKKAGKAKVILVAKVASGKPKVDKDKDILTCVPVPGTCPTFTTTSTTTATTSTTSTSTTTSTNPCAEGSVACSCGATTPTGLRFVTGAPDGTNCGEVTNESGHLIDLICGGLYFGGGNDTVPLPSRIPDMGASLTKVGCCKPDPVTMQLTDTTDTDIGGAHGNRQCTNSTVTNPEYPTRPGCLFGPPLPIPNLAAPSLSTCVINRVSTSASGTANCTTGASQINLPLGSDIYLTGDLLSDVPGTQPCPICSGPSGSETCAGGPNNGMACTPGDTDLPTVCTSGANQGMACTTDADCPGTGAVCNHPYPTSHDCPPPHPDAPCDGSQTGGCIGTLPIAFALNTETVSRTAVDQAAQTNVFCGFCATQSTAFQNPAVPCSTEADCTDPTFPRCRQRNPGAFATNVSPGPPPARTITENGVAAGDLTDRAPHPSTLVSVFCIPPTFNGAVDAAADLPGPGAVALKGQATLLP